LQNSSDVTIIISINPGQVKGQTSGRIELGKIVNEKIKTLNQFIQCKISIIRNRNSLSRKNLMFPEHKLDNKSSKCEQKCCNFSYQKY
jgi:hypothetical protein